MKADSDPIPAPARLRTRAAREANGADVRVRVRAVLLVALMLAGILIAGAVVRAGVPRAAKVSRGGQLPVVNLASSTAVEWECPGPLLAGSSSQQSSVVIDNPGRASARVQVFVDAVAAFPRKAERALPSWSTALTLAPHSQSVVALHRTGPRQDDAVSVLETAGSVAVFESTVTVTRMAASTGGKKPTPRSSPSSTRQESPCATGGTTSSYIAAGSTGGRSDILVALFDPTATQAVVGIRASSASGVVVPPALQGLIIRPYSLEVFDLARLVVQQDLVAISDETSVGRVVLGAYETVASDPTAATALHGQALVLGIGSPRSSWVMTPGPAARGGTVSLDVYDPGSREAEVSISSSSASSQATGQPVVEISAIVPAGEVREITLPSPTVASARTAKASSRQALRGPIVLRVAGGVGVVVARSDVQQVAARTQTVALLAATCELASEWLLPVASTTSAAGALPEHGDIVISDPGAAQARIEVLQLTTAGPLGRSQLATLSLAPGTTATLALSLPAHGTAFAGLELISSSPVVAEQDFSPVGPHRRAVLVAPAPLQGIPLFP
ncbi:MAG: DUF5719 family protein [Acidimicrobiales bacterium]